jgi:hypothetical protein
MSEFRNRSLKTKSEHEAFLALSKKSLRDAQQVALREDARFGLKPVIVGKPKRRKTPRKTESPRVSR